MALFGWLVGGQAAKRGPPLQSLNLALAVAVHWTGKLTAAAVAVAVADILDATANRELVAVTAG